jgi:hypothetical protein
MEKDVKLFAGLCLAAPGNYFLLIVSYIFSPDNGIPPGKGGKGADGVQQRRLDG